MKIFRKSAQQGFSLVELLIVVVVIGVLAGIAVPGFFTAYEKAKDKKVITDMRNIAVAIGIYRIDKNYVPITNDITVLIDEIRNYANGSNPMSTHDTWGNKFIYLSDADGTTYTLMSYGKDRAAGPSYATIGHFDANADTLVVNGVFRASHGGTSAVAY